MDGKKVNERISRKAKNKELKDIVFFHTMTVSKDRRKKS